MLIHMSRGKTKRHPALEPYPIWVRSLYVLKAHGIDLDINVLEGRTVTKEPTLDEMFSFDILNTLHHHSRLQLHLIVEKLSHTSSNAAVLSIMRSLVDAGLVKSQAQSGASEVYRSKTNQARPKGNQPRSYWITQSGVAQRETWAAQGWGEITCSPSYEPIPNAAQPEQTDFGN